MAIFGTGSGVGSTYATCLLTFPDVDWFKRNIVGAIDQMTLDFNWSEDGDVGVSFAVEESEKMLEAMLFMGFNPFPPGMMFPFGADAAPDGYLLCDGNAYSSTDYPELFAAIGYGFGGSAGSFNVPDLRNRVAIGSGDIYALAATGGEEEVFLDVAAMPSHTHTDIGHQHTIPLVTSLPAQAGVGFAGDVTVPIVTNVTGIASANNQNTGGDGAHNNLQPYQAANFIIYAGR
jgi:microcystin-dependent protein